jgi:hypothetical protein
MISLYDMQSRVQDIHTFRSAMYRGQRDEHRRSTYGPDGRTHSVDMLKMMCLSEMLDYGLDSAEVRDSPIHGRGVFATQPINSGDIITFYPGDHVAYMPNKDRKTAGHVQVRMASGRARARGETTAQLDNAYTYDLNRNFSIQGDPGFTDDPNYLGHMINDGARANSNPKSHAVYIACSTAKANCGFARMDAGLAVAMRATRDIAVGEEILVPYGIGYWVS